VVDTMAMQGLDIAPPPDELVQWLRSHRIDIGYGRLVDLTLAGARAAIVQGTISRLLADPGNDAVLMVVGSSAQFQPELAVAPLTEFAKAEKPFAVALLPSAERAVRLLTDAGIAVYRNPESCAEAMVACLLRTAPRPRNADGAGSAAAAAALRDGQSAGFDESRASALFAALGVPMAERRIATTPQDAARHAADLGGALVLKILSPDIGHKTEIGGVELELRGSEATEAAATRMLARVRKRAPAARIEGLLLQRMERGLAEVIIGFQRDALVGPTITVGLGGAGRPDGSPAHDRGGARPGDHPRLSQSAEGRYRGAGGSDCRRVAIGASGIGGRCRGRDQSRDRARRRPRRGCGRWSRDPRRLTRHSAVPDRSGFLVPLVMSMRLGAIAAGAHLAPAAGAGTAVVDEDPAAFLVGATAHALAPRCRQ